MLNEPRHSADSLAVRRLSFGFSWLDRAARLLYRTLTNSTSNSSVAFGGMTPPAPRAP